MAFVKRRARAALSFARCVTPTLSHLPQCVATRAEAAPAAINRSYLRFIFGAGCALDPPFSSLFGFLAAAARRANRLLATRSEEVAGARNRCGVAAKIQFRLLPSVESELFATFSTRSTKLLI